MKHCPICNTLIPQGHGYHAAQIYCSLSCARVKNRPPRHEIVELLNKNHNVTVTAQLLGVYKQALYQWMEQYGIKKTVRYE
jgi:transcriptional regulator with PAS, ATPase and Fis domain